MPISQLLVSVKKCRRHKDVVAKNANLQNVNYNYAQIADSYLPVPASLGSVALGAQFSPLNYCAPSVLVTFGSQFK